MFTKRSTSGFFMVLAVFNLIVAVIPPIAGTIGVIGMMKDSDIVLNGKQVGPEFDKEVAKEAPLAKIESFAALGGNAFACLLMLAGSVGLFMGYGVGRWATVAGAVFMILSLFVHDIYQIFIYRPALMTVFDRIAAPFLLVFQNLPGPQGQDNPARAMLAATIAGLRWGILVYTCAWSCTNPLIMLYLFAMAMCMAFMTGFYDSGGIDKGGAKPALRGEEDDDEDEDEDEDDEEERRPAKKKRKVRGDDEED